MTARAYVFATFISRYDVGRWPTWLVGLALVAWLALGLVGIAVTRAPWIPALWIPAAGFLLWRSAGLSLVEILSWVVPLGVLLVAAELLSGPARQLAIGLLFAITAAFLCSGRVQAWWVMTIRQARPEDLRRLPASAVQLISVTNRVDRALGDSPWGPGSAVLVGPIDLARQDLAALSFPPGDPWLEVRREAMIWLRDLAALARRPDRGVVAYAAVNRRTHRFRRADAKARRITNSRSSDRGSQGG